jgi:hypothetical protein
VLDRTRGRWRSEKIAIVKFWEIFGIELREIVIFVWNYA